MSMINFFSKIKSAAVHPSHKVGGGVDTPNTSTSSSSTLSAMSGKDIDDDISTITGWSETAVTQSSRPYAFDLKKEVRKLQDLVDAAIKAEEHQGFWNQERLWTLHNVTVRAFVGTIIGGVVFFFLSQVWSYLFSSFDIIFRVDLDRYQVVPQELEAVQVKVSFLEGVKFAEHAFTAYSLGTLILILGGSYALLTLRAPYRSRTWRFLLSIFYILIATAFMIYGPLVPILASNNGTELHSLRLDETVAYQKGIKGTIHYFRQGQCGDIDKSVTGQDEKVAAEMRLFCDMLLRLMIVIYFMCATTILPIFAVVICSMQIKVNRKYWRMLTLVAYKERSKTDVEKDRCTRD